MFFTALQLVSEVQAVYPWLTGPPHPYDGFMAALGKTRLSSFDIFKMLSVCADVQTKLNFYFQTFAVICGHSSVWWGVTVHKGPPPRRTVQTEDQLFTDCPMISR